MRLILKIMCLIKGVDNPFLYVLRKGREIK